MYNQELIEKVEELRGKRVIKKDVDICSSTGFSNTVVSNYLKGKIKASRNFIEKFEEAYGVKVFEKKVVKMTNFPETDQSASLLEIIKANKIMAESILKASEAQLVDAETRKMLVDNNTDLTKIIKGITKVTADVAQQSHSAGQPISAALLEVLAELGVGKGWRSKQEGVVALGMRLLPGNGKKKKDGSVADAGR